MTEQDFFRQIWRAYDKVTFDGGIKARVTNVCFSTRSVKVSMTDGEPEWVRCERIDKHTSQTGAPADEDKVVENMFKELMAADEKMKRQTEEINRLKETVSSLQQNKENRILNLLAELKHGLMAINEGLTIKKSKLEDVERGMKTVSEIISLLKGDMSQDVSSIQ